MKVETTIKLDQSSDEIYGSLFDLEIILKDDRCNVLDYYSFSVPQDVETFLSNCHKVIYDSCQTTNNVYVLGADWSYDFFPSRVVNYKGLNFYFCEEEHE